MLRAFEELTEHSGRRFAKIGKELRRHGRREIRRIRKADAGALAERWLKKTGRRVARLKIRAGGWRAIEPGL